MNKKTQPSTLIVVASCLSLGFLLVGCASIKNSLFRPNLVTNDVPASIVLKPVTNLVEVIVTNTVREVVTNTIQGEPVVVQVEKPVYVTNVIERVSTNLFVTPPTTQVVTSSWSIKPEAEVATSAASLFGPYGAAAGTFGSAALNLALLWINRRQKQLNGVESDTSATLVQSVEQIRLALRSTAQGRELDDKLVKPILENGKVKAGADVVANLEALVKSRTINTTQMDTVLASLQKLATPSYSNPEVQLAPPVFSTANGRTIGQLRSIWGGFEPRPNDLLPGELELFALWDSQKTSV